MSAQANTSFTPADKSAQWTTGLLRATVAVLVVSILSGLGQIDLLSRAASGGWSGSEAAANDARQQLIGVLQFVLYLGTAIAFVTWLRRANRNLEALGGRDLLHSSSAAAWAFFIPFVNLVRPVQVMRELWHGSDPLGLERDTGSEGPSVRNQLPTPALVGWWWTLFLAFNLFGNISGRMAMQSGQTLDELRSMSVLLVLSDVIEIPAALVAAALVSRITGWQQLRWMAVVRRGEASIEVAARL